MTTPNVTLIRNLVLEEIRRIVAGFISSRSCLDSGRHAAEIARAYPNSGMSADEIAEEIITAAVHARVPIEMNRPKPL